jgi:hypothetical protein
MGHFYLHLFLVEKKGTILRIPLDKASPYPKPQRGLASTKAYFYTNNG